MVIGFSLLIALALQLVTSAHTIVFLGTLPLFTAIFAVWQRGKRPPALFWLLSLLGSSFVAVFWTGCRPSEMIALRWSDIDWFNESLIISKSRVRGVEKQVTKTHNVREVYLNDRSKRAFEAISELGLSTEYVMICPETNSPFYNEKPSRLRLLQAMKSTRVRHRPAYNARHTYATMLLMSEVNPVFVPNQLGHSLQMLIKRYGRWIHGDQNKIEISKLNTD